MGGKSGIRIPKIKAPKITIGKDLGAKNIGQGLSSVAKSAGNVGSQLVKTAGKGAEGLVANTADIGSALAKGDFKGIGKEALELVQSGKDIAKGLTSAGLTATVAPAAALGAGTGSKELSKTAANVEREGNKGINKYGDMGADLALSSIPGIGQGYALAKAAASGLAKDGIEGILSGKGLQDAALSAAASKFGIDPTMMSGAKAGLSALQGDVKGAALQGLGSFGGLNENQLKMASTGASALTGDKKGLASGLASQFGAGDMTSNMIGQFAGGKGAREVVSDQIGAYAGDEANAMLDKMGVAGLGKDQVRAIQDMQNKAQSAYKIAKGDSFNAIAKKLGVTPEQLKAANPQIKDINKIAAGADLNIPGAISRSAEAYAKNVGLDQVVDFNKIKKDAEVISKIPGGIPADIYEKARSDVTDKYLKDASGKTIMGPNNAPILNPDFNAKEYDKLQARRAELEEDAATYVPGQQLGEEKWTMDRVLGNIKREGGKALDQIKGGAGAVGGAVSGALGAAKDFAAENKTGLELAADAAASYAGYQAGKESLGKAEDLQKKQLRDLQAQGAKFEGMSYDPTRYKQQQEMLDQSIAGGGRSALTRQLATESDMEAGRAEAAARASALQKLAETGGGAGIGGGAFLQSAFSGAAAGAGARGKAGLERATIAEKQYREDIARKTDLSRQQTQEEADLARQQGVFGLDKTEQVGGVRTTLGNIELDRGRALQNMYTQGAETIKTALGNLQTPEEKARADANAKYQEEMKQLDLERKRQEVYGKPQQQTTPPPSPEKVAGAKQVSQGTGVVQAAPVQQAPKTSAGQFNATYSGPVARPAENQQPQNPMQQIQSTVGGFVNQAKANPQQAVQTVQKKVEEVKKDPVKAVTGMVNQWMGK
jgi:LysM repeat protein